MRPVPILIALTTVLASCSSITDPEVAELPEITVGPETTTPSAVDTSTTEAPIVLDNTPQAPTAAGSLADYGARLAATALAGPIDTPCGTIAVADPDSVLLAALLVSDCTVDTADGSTRSLSDVLSQPGRTLVTGIHCTVGGSGSLHATGRTPMDTPIVAAVGRRGGDRVTVALTGVAPTPVLVDPSDPTGAIEPRSDFRGSAEYR
ncbi:MAG: hypothetical protein ACO4A1_09600, partial [Ilumatobacteraceae bacterium]